MCNFRPVVCANEEEMKLEDRVKELGEGYLGERRLLEKVTSE